MWNVLIHEDARPYTSKLAARHPQAWEALTLRMQRLACQRNPLASKAVRKLAGETALYRIRGGGLRAEFTLDSSRHTLVVLVVAKRSDAYRQATLDSAAIRAAERAEAGI